MEEEIKSLQQEVLFLTKRVIELERTDTENKESWMDLIHRLSNLETRLIALEEARKRQIELNQELINGTSTRQEKKEKKPWWRF